MSDKELLQIAHTALKTSRETRKAINGIANALDSIAASMLVIARNSQNVSVESSSQQIDMNQIELLVRRLQDGEKTQTISTKK